jgi:hypothetical protein
MSSIVEIEKDVREHCSPKAITNWLHYQGREALLSLKKVVEPKDYRYQQGRLSVIDELLELLAKYK